LTHCFEQDLMDKQDYNRLFNPDYPDYPLNPYSTTDQGSKRIDVKFNQVNCQNQKFYLRMT
jgi:hypothetical protein